MLKKLLNLSMFSFDIRIPSRDPIHSKTKELINIETSKRPFRSDVINFVLQILNRETNYLEIGVRDPGENFDRIHATNRFSVDPGLEYKSNPVDFVMTSDEFFHKLSCGDVLNPEMKFDVIFVDGLHLAEQVDRDIQNSLMYLSEDGFIVLHDCNPPTEYCSREDFQYKLSPAGVVWNGTTWKAFVKWRQNANLYSCTVDTDWGVGILSKRWNIGSPSVKHNEFFEYSKFHADRSESLGLLKFDEFCSRLNQLK
jgi:hypothetical protein